jgi:hypothetical protein
MIGKRALVWIVAAIFGAVVSFATLVIFNTTVEKYGVSNVGVMAIASGALLWIWLDYALGTEMLSK